MKEYMVTTALQTWDNNQWEVYRLDDKKRWYLCVDGSGSGYRVETVQDQICTTRKFFFDDFADAELEVKLKVYNSNSYNQLKITRGYLPNAVVCDCGLYVSPNDTGDVYIDDGQILEDDALLCSKCLCGKVHKFRRHVKVVVDVSYTVE